MHYHFPIFPISPYLASPHPGFLAIFLSWIFCPTHSRISIPAATDLCALLLTRFAPDNQISSHCYKIWPSGNHPWKSILTYLSFKHLKHNFVKSGPWRSWQAPSSRGSHPSRLARRHSRLKLLKIINWDKYNWTIVRNTSQAGLMFDQFWFTNGDVCMFMISPMIIIIVGNCIYMRWANKTFVVMMFQC